MLRVATYNVHDCIGRDGRYLPERTAEVLLTLDAEVIALQEITLDAAGELQRRLEKALDMQVTDGTLFERGVGRYGNVLLTHHRIVEQRLHDLSFVGREPRGLLDVVLEHDGQRLQVFATHLGLVRRERRWQIERLCSQLALGQGPSLLLGDFNVWRGGGELHPIAARGYMHLPVRSFPTWRRPLLALDHVFCRTPAVALRCWRHDTPLSRVASDHYPVVAEIQREE
jgi:endonuclease/exonuclease/phosphatase family metal-dependent hydrolase